MNKYNHNEAVMWRLALTRAKSCHYMLIIYICWILCWRFWKIRQLLYSRLLFRHTRHSNCHFCVPWIFFSSSSEGDHLGVTDANVFTGQLPFPPVNQQLYSTCMEAAIVKAKLSYSVVCPGRRRWLSVFPKEKSKLHVWKLCSMLSKELALNLQCDICKVVICKCST